MRLCVCVWYGEMKAYLSGFIVCVCARLCMCVCVCVVWRDEGLALMLLCVWVCGCVGDRDSVQGDRLRDFCFQYSMLCIVRRML